MKNLSLLLYILAIKSEKIITNINLPSCKNCIFHKPNSHIDFASTLSLCEKFGEKNIITDNITYEYADVCRNNESKCGKEGRFFEEQPNTGVKMAMHFIVKNVFINIYILILVIYINYVKSIFE
jgi:hypothetical protein